MVLEIGTIYSDLAYQPKLTQKGDVRVVKNQLAIKQSLLTIINTPKGTRLFEPNFGCDIKRLLFEHYHPEIADSIRSELEESIRRYETRIKDLSVNVNMNDANEEYIVDITYTLREVRIRDSLNITLQRL